MFQANVPKLVYQYITYFIYITNALKTEGLKKLIKKECTLTTKKGKETFDVSPFKKRNAEKLKKQIDKIKKHSNYLGNYAVTYAIGMYSYPDIFTQQYIARKHEKFLNEMESYQTKLQSMLLEYAKPLYILFAPKE